MTVDFYYVHAFSQCHNIMAKYTRSAHEISVLIAYATSKCSDMPVRPQVIPEPYILSMVAAESSQHLNGLSGLLRKHI